MAIALIGLLLVVALGRPNSSPSPPENLALDQTLTAQDKVSLHTTTYPQDAVNDAMAELDHGRLRGRGISSPQAPHEAEE